MASVLGLSGGGSFLFHNRRKSLPPIMTFPDFRSGLQLPDGIVIVQGTSVAEMVERVLKPFGGMSAIIRSGDRVLIKPNVAWDRSPEQAATTHPELVASLVRMALVHGASEVIVSDVACNDPRKTFNRSGIKKAAEEAGGKVIIPETFRDIDYGGKIISQFPTGEVFLKADRIINVPIVKHHSLTRVTIGMKNLYGVIGGRRHKLHQEVHQSIVDLAGAVKPTFTVVDATRVLMANGPQGGSISNVKTMNMIAAGTDPVALDAWGSEFLNLTPGDVQHLKLAALQGLGRYEYRSRILAEENL